MAGTQQAGSSNGQPQLTEKKCSGALVGIGTADLRFACTCHWMEPVYPISVYYQRDER